MVHVWYSRSIIFLELIILHIIKNEGNVNCYDWYNLFLKKKKKIIDIIYYSNILFEWPQKKKKMIDIIIKYFLYFRLHALLTFLLCFASHWMHQMKKTLGYCNLE